MSDDDSELPWSTNRHQVAYEQGVRVLEGQKDDIDDLDDKALRTVRITAILLGVGATGIRVTGTGNINNLMAATGLMSFFLSLLFGVIVYNESAEVIGATSTYIQRLRRDDFHADWEDDFLVQVTGWIDENQNIVEFNSGLLIACQSFFILGVGIGSASLVGLSWSEVLVLFVLVVFVVLVVFYILVLRINDE